MLLWDAIRFYPCGQCPVEDVPIHTRPEVLNERGLVPLPINIDKRPEVEGWPAIGAKEKVDVARIDAYSAYLLKASHDVVLFVIDDNLQALARNRATGPEAVNVHPSQGVVLRVLLFAYKCSFRVLSHGHTRCTKHTEGRKSKTSALLCVCLSIFPFRI